MPIELKSSTTTLSPKPHQSSTYESVAQSNQIGSSEQIIHTETRCVTETMVRLEHKSPQPDSQTDLQLCVHSVKPFESITHVTNNTDTGPLYTHKTQPNLFKHDEYDIPMVEENRVPIDSINMIGGKCARQKEIFLPPKPANNTYQVFQAAENQSLMDGKWDTPEKSRIFSINAANYELKAPALVSSIESLSMVNGHLSNGIDNNKMKHIVENESSYESIQRKPMDFTSQKHANQPIYHNRFNVFETKYYSNTTPKTDYTYDAITPMQANEKVRIHYLLRTNCRCCLCIVDDHITSQICHTCFHTTLSKIV